MKVIRYNLPSAWPAFSPLPVLSRELNRLLEAPLNEFARASHLFNSWTPAVDAFENENDFVVKAELPGLKMEEIAVTVDDNVLVITGERKAESQAEETVLHRNERFSGKFQRSVQLPKPVAADKVTAAYKDGVLTVTLPKTEEAKPKQIKINVD
jgi:HSP20 family protein